MDKEGDYKWHDSAENAIGLIILTQFVHDSGEKLDASEIDKSDMVLFSEIDATE